MLLEAILFDIDGTLVDSNEQHVQAWAFAFREAGHALEPDDIRLQIGKGGDLLVPALLPGLGRATAERIAKRHGDLFKDMYLDQVRAFPGAAELIERSFRSGCKVVLASSAKRDELDHYEDLLGVRDYLAATTSIDDVETSKPEPDIFSSALDKIVVAPEHAVVIGDTIYDIEAARAAGVVAIGLTSGPYSRVQLKDAGAIAVFDDVADLLRQFDHSILARPR